MPNFFYDNDDIQFLFHHFDLAELARIQEHYFLAKTTIEFSYDFTQLFAN